MLVLIFGLGSAFLFASSAALQQRAARAAVAAPAQRPATGRLALALPVLRVARRLMANRLFLLGCVANVVGSLVQAAALYVGSVAVVQVLLVTQLIFTLPLASLWDRRWPSALEWLSGASICAGVAVFLSVRGAAPQAGAVDRWRMLLAVVFACGLVGILLLVATGRRAWTHAIPVAIGAGVFFAVSAALMKLTTTDLLDRGVPATAVDWPGYLLALANLAGFVLEQDAFAAGSLPSAVAAMTITNPLASYLIGVLAFNAAFPSGAGALAAVAGAAVLVVAGVSGLARSPTVATHRPAARPLPGGGTLATESPS